MHSYLKQKDSECGIRWCSEHLIIDIILKHEKGRYILSLYRFPESFCVP